MIKIGKGNHESSKRLIFCQSSSWAMSREEELTSRTSSSVGLRKKGDCSTKKGWCESYKSMVLSCSILLVISSLVLRELIDLMASS